MRHNIHFFGRSKIENGFFELFIMAEKVKKMVKKVNMLILVIKSKIFLASRRVGKYFCLILGHTLRQSIHFLGSHIIVFFLFSPLYSRKSLAHSLTISPN